MYLSKINVEKEKMFMSQLSQEFIAEHVRLYPDVAFNADIAGFNHEMMDEFLASFGYASEGEEVENIEDKKVLYQMWKKEQGAYLNKVSAEREM